MKEKESFTATTKLSLKRLDLFSSLEDTLYTSPLRDSTHIHSGRGWDLSADWDSHGLGNWNDTCDVHFRENTWLTESDHQAPKHAMTVPFFTTMTTAKARSLDHHLCAHG